MHCHSLRCDAFKIRFVQQLCGKNATSGPRETLLLDHVLQHWHFQIQGSTLEVLEMLKKWFLCSLACLFVFVSPCYVGVRILHFATALRWECPKHNVTEHIKLVLQFCCFAVSTRYQQPSRFACCAELCFPPTVGIALGKWNRKGPMLPRWIRNLRVCVLKRKH